MVGGRGAKRGESERRRREEKEGEIRGRRNLQLFYGCGL